MGSSGSGGALKSARSVGAASARERRVRRAWRPSARVTVRESCPAGAETVTRAHAPSVPVDARARRKASRSCEAALPGGASVTTSCVVQGATGLGWALAPRATEDTPRSHWRNCLTTTLSPRPGGTFKGRTISFSQGER
ncbi:MAG: hypothetical protein HY909_25870 [Deltaproteobacteria bacterium]|nr:hypothetical protein [Deltaproteobacteria bacterium]